ncbi:MAG: hypothetical protein ABH868_01930 [bacterium]
MQDDEMRGLAKTAGWIFVIIGVLVAVKGAADMIFLAPSSEFVTPENWMRFAFFELVYGLACVLIGEAIFSFVRRYLQKQ